MHIWKNTKEKEMVKSKSAAAHQTIDRLMEDAVLHHYGFPSSPFTYSKNPLTRTYILPDQPGIGSYIFDI